MPVLWDKKTCQIVNNESEDIMRLLNTAFNNSSPEGSQQKRLDLHPLELRDKINENKS